MEMYGSGVAASVLAIVLLVLAALTLLLLLLLFVLIRLHIKHDGCAGAPFTLMETIMAMGVRNYHDVLDKAPGELVLRGGSAEAVFCCSNCKHRSTISNCDFSQMKLT